MTAILNAITPQAVTPVTNFSKTNGKVFFRNQTIWITYALEPPSIAVPNVWSLLLATVSMAAQEKIGIPIGIFAPGYSNGATYGTYQAATLRTLNDWINYGESGRGFNSDVAFSYHL